MKKAIFIYVAAVIVLTAATIFISTAYNLEIYCVYSSSIRSVTITAFMTMGSFMLSLLGLFMFSFKTQLFDSSEYEKIYKESRNNTNINISKYEPLVNISKIFMFCIFCCFLTAFLQLTVGTIPLNIIGAFCTAMAIATILLAMYILYILWNTLDVWFKILLSR